MDKNTLYILFIFDISNRNLPSIRIKYQSSPTHKRIGPFLDKTQSLKRGFVLYENDEYILNKLNEHKFFTSDKLRPQIFLDSFALYELIDTQKCFLQEKKKGSIKILKRDLFQKKIKTQELQLKSKTSELLGGHVIYEDNTQNIYWEYENCEELVQDLPKEGIFLYFRNIHGEWIARTFVQEKALKDELENPLADLLPQEQATHSASKWKFSFKSNKSNYIYSYGKIDWFDVSNIDYLTKNLNISIDELIVSYLHNRNFLKSNDTIFRFEKKINELLDEDIFIDLVSAKSQFPKQQIYSIQKKIVDDNVIINLQLSLSQAGFKGELKNYQYDAVYWMLQLRKENIGGILADEMGLGKTIEIIAYILLSLKDGNDPFLIVCPKTLVENWRNEFLKFTTVQDISINMDCNAISCNKTTINIVTYKSFTLHADSISKYHFDTVILDEAQFIKNSDTLSHKKLMSVNSSCRIALTGTPIENYLTDVWSLIIFVNPFLIKAYAQLKKIFTDFKRNNYAASFSYKTLGSLVLRRTKEDVLLNLPPLNSEIIRCDMGTEQRDIYQNTLQIFQKMLSDGTTGRIESIALEAINRLRQACSDPSMLPLSLNMYNSIESIKINTSVDITKQCIKNGEKIIIFSQFHYVTDRLTKIFNAANIQCFVLDGRAKNRIDIINDFEDSKESVFIIGLKSGGFGMNLVSATNVILFDPWWNPAVEEQAFARTHRIGQKKPVFVKKLICTDTIEEKMLSLIEAKRQLSNSIFDLAYSPNIDDLIKIINE